MKKRKTIFLSYRRDDNPGYVRQLQEDLQNYFGDNNVFRDVEDITGGQQWKQVLLDSLAQSAALVVIIGQRWEQIWNERIDKDNDYIVYELNKAREHGIPVIPVTINGTVLSKGIDLGPISWLMDNQHYDISDRQGRWPTDVLGLVNILEREKGLVKKKQKKEKSSNKYLLIPLIIAVLAFIGYLVEPEIQPSPIKNVQLPQSVTPTPITIPSSEPLPELSSISSYPDIAGLWQGDNGIVYEVGQVVNGRFMFGNTEIVGYGQFKPNMPRKFAVQVAGLGYGEYSVTTDNLRLVGWFYYNATNGTEYYTLWRVN